MAIFSSDSKQQDTKPADWKAGANNDNILNNQTWTRPIYKDGKLVGTANLARNPEGRLTEYNSVDNKYYVWQSEGKKADGSYIYKRPVYEDGKSQGMEVITIDQGGVARGFDSRSDITTTATRAWEPPATPMINALELGAKPIGAQTLATAQVETPFGPGWHKDGNGYGRVLYDKNGNLTGSQAWENGKITSTKGYGNPVKPELAATSVANITEYGLAKPNAMADTQPARETVDHGTKIKPVSSYENPTPAIIASGEKPRNWETEPAKNIEDQKRNQTVVIDGSKVEGATVDFFKDGREVIHKDDKIIGYGGSGISGNVATVAHPPVETVAQVTSAELSSGFKQTGSLLSEASAGVAHAAESGAYAKGIKANQGVTVQQTGQPAPWFDPGAQHAPGSGPAPWFDPGAQHAPGSEPAPWFDPGAQHAPPASTYQHSYGVPDPAAYAAAKAAANAAAGLKPDPVPSAAQSAFHGLQPSPTDRFDPAAFATNKLPAEPATSVSLNSIGEPYPKPAAPEPVFSKGAPVPVPGSPYGGYAGPAAEPTTPPQMGRDQMLSGDLYPHTKLEPATPPADFSSAAFATDKLAGPTGATATVSGPNTPAPPPLGKKEPEVVVPEVKPATQAPPQDSLVIQAQNLRTLAEASPKPAATTVIVSHPTPAAQTVLEHHANMDSPIPVKPKPAPAAAPPPAPAAALVTPPAHPNTPAIASPKPSGVTNPVPHLRRLDDDFSGGLTAFNVGPDIKSGHGGR